MVNNSLTVVSYLYQRISQCISVRNGELHIQRLNTDYEIFTKKNK